LHHEASKTVAATKNVLVFVFYKLVFEFSFSQINGGAQALGGLTGGNKFLRQMDNNFAGKLFFTPARSLFNFNISVRAFLRMTAQQMI